MPLYFLYFLYVLTILVELFLLLFLLLIAFSMFAVGAPFVPADKKVLGEIIKAIDIKENSVFYDLGCGDGRILVECRKKQPGAKLVGIEKFPLPYLVARLNLRFFNKNTGITIKRKDIFEEDLSSATHVYTYLLPKLMDKLLPKLERELKPGAKLISPEFGFSGKKPSQVIELGEKQGRIIKKINIYEF